MSRGGEVGRCGRLFLDGNAGWAIGRSTFALTTPVSKILSASIMPYLVGDRDSVDPLGETRSDVPLGAGGVAIVRMDAAAT